MYYWLYKCTQSKLAFTVTNTHLHKPDIPPTLQLLLAETHTCYCRAFSLTQHYSLCPVLFLQLPSAETLTRPYADPVGLFHWPSTVPPAKSADDPSARRLWNVTHRTRHSRDCMIQLLAHPPTPSPVSKLDRRHTGRLRNRDNMLTSDGGEGGGGQWAESYEHKKTFSSMNHSILSAYAVQESGMSPSLRNWASGIQNDETEYICICTIVHIYR